MDDTSIVGGDIDTDGEDSVKIGVGVGREAGGEKSGVDRGSIDTDDEEEADVDRGNIDTGDEEEADVDAEITISLLRSSGTSSFSPYSTRGLLEVL